MQQNNTCQFGFVRYETRIGNFDMFGGSPNRNILVLKCEACDSLVLCLPEQKPLNKTHLRDKTFSQNTSIYYIYYTTLYYTGYPRKKYLSQILGSQIHKTIMDQANKQNGIETAQTVQNCPMYPKWSDTIWSRTVTCICGTEILDRYFFSSVTPCK